MRDEEYLYYSDCREKKNVARSARHKRTHNGKGGAVKFPSDYMTKKELQEMNGKCETYPLNNPMTWTQFLAMPDDIKVMYIKAIKAKWHTPAIYLEKMFGCNHSAFYKEMNRLGLIEGTNGRNKSRKWDKDGFLAWWHGVPTPKCETPDDTAEVEEIVEEKPETKEPEKSIEKIPESKPVKMAVPDCGNMVFEGRAEDIANTICAILGGANVHLSITWDVLPDPIAGVGG